MMMLRMMMLRRREGDDVEDNDVEEDRSQDLGPDFVGACAGEMHFNISQDPF